MQINKIRMRLYITYMYLEISKYCNYELQFLNIVFILANRADPDEIMQFAAFIWVFTVCQSIPLGFSIIQRVFTPETTDRNIFPKHSMSLQSDLSVYKIQVNVLHGPSPDKYYNHKIIKGE